MGTAGLVLLDLLLVLALARVLRALLARVRQPPVMGEVLAGLVLGASVLGMLPGDPSAALFTPDARAVLAVLGQVAIVGYLFAAGAELDLGALRREGRVVAAVALGSFLVPWAAGAALAVAVHDGVATDPPLVPFALFLGTALAVTAFPVLARIVDARGLREQPAGRVALAAAAAQELLVWPALAVAVALGSGADASPLAVAVPGAGALALVVVLARVVAPRLPATGVLAALAASAVATELAGLHLVLGAFLFGVVLPGPARDGALALLRTRSALALSAVLLPVFFALPATRVDVAALGAGGLGLLAVVLVVAFAAKLLSASVAARLAGMPRPEAVAVGALMNARGLVELVVLSVGLDAGLVDARLFAVMVLMALATTFATGPLVDRAQRTGSRRAAARSARRLVHAASRPAHRT